MTFRSGDHLVDGRWRIESIADDHVVLVPARKPEAGTFAGVLLRPGEKVPDLSQSGPVPSVHYRIQGILVDEADLQDPSDRAGDRP